MSPITRTILEAGVPTLAVTIGLIVEGRAFKRMREQIQNLIDDIGSGSERARQAYRLR